jgi:anti-sigma B factor antagonist
MAYNLTTRQSGEVTVIQLSGCFDLGPDSTVLHDMLHDVEAGGAKKILLNLREVSFIDSSGLGELTSGHVRARHDGISLKLTCPSRRVEELFQMTGLSKVLDIYDDESDALGSWTQSGQNTDKILALDETAEPRPA